jgi:hypothetical protein
VSSAPGHSHGQSRGSCWQRLRGWLTYRALPVPRECKCCHMCSSGLGCTPPLYTYFALRYPTSGHGYEAPLGGAPVHAFGPHNP